jgi:hypothetical protein
MDGAGERCSHMLAEGEKPPLMLYLIWAEYTRLAKEIASAAFFGSSIDRSEVLNQEFVGRPDELNFTLDEVTEKMANFERALDPDDLIS